MRSINSENEFNGKIVIINRINVNTIYIKGMHRVV